VKVIPIKVSAGITGFESPCAEYSQLSLSLDELLIERPHSTWLGIASGTSMTGMGIWDGDLMIVDRAKERKSGDVVVASLNGEFVVKVWDAHNRQLLSSRQVGEFEGVTVSSDDDFCIEGVVTRAIRMLVPSYLFATA
jgi:DNA polymerase V